MIMEEEHAKQRYRSLPKGLAIVTEVILVTMAICGILYIFQVHLYLGIPLLEVQYLAIFLSLALAAVFLLFPSRKQVSLQKVPWYDIGLALLSIAFGAYVVIKWPYILLNPRMTYLNVGLGCAATLALMEATRRVLGLPLLLFSLGSIAIALWGDKFHLHNINYPWQRWFFFFYLDENGIYGSILGLMGSVIFAFIAFGRLLVVTGIAQNLINLTTALVGRFTGGHAKAAVVASALMGLITGSVSVNAITVGTITIPLMKRWGYPSEFAAGVESAASSGGPLMPPVMGVTAFLVAQFLGISYYQVAIAGFLPAIIYFAGVFSQVDGEARALGLKGIPVDQLPAKGKAFIEALPFFVPLSVIVYMLFVLRIAPERVGLYAALSVAIVGVFYKSARRQLLYFFRILADIGRSLLELAVVGGMAGVITSPLVLSGVGTAMAAGLRDMAGGNIFLLLVMAAVANLILGLGLPAIITYILMAVLVTPTMIQAGVLPLAAHMFTLYFAVAAELTPPAGAPIYITMIIAEANFLGTAFSAMRLASAIFILPFVFTYRYGLLVEGPVWVILGQFLLTLAGVCALALSFEGYLGRKLVIYHRFLLAFAGVALLVPMWKINALGAAIMVFELAAGWGYRRRLRAIPDDH